MLSVNARNPLLSGSFAARWVLVAGLSMVVAGALSPPADAQLNPGRLSGKLTDEEGNPVGGIQLRLLPQEQGSAQPKIVKVNKKGKFSVAFLPAGRWKIEAVDESQFLKSMKYVHKNAQGLKSGDFEANGHPTGGLPAFSVGVNAHGQMELVVADAAYRENLAKSVRLQKVSGPMKKIVKLYESGDMDTVVSETSGILETDPGLPAALYLRGSALWQLKRYAEAESDMRQALEGDPELHQIHGILGTILIERGRELKADGQTDEAMSRFNDAVELTREEIRRTPDDPAFRLNLVVALDSADRQEEMGAELEALVEADPSNLDAALKLADHYAIQQRYDDALALIDRLGLEGAGMADILYNVAVGHYNTGNMEEARAFADKVIGVEPDHVLVKRLLGYLVLAGGDKAGALEHFRNYVELAGDETTQTERELIQALEGSGG